MADFDDPFKPRESGAAPGGPAAGSGARPTRPPRRKTSRSGVAAPARRRPRARSSATGSPLAPAGRSRGESAAFSPGDCRTLRWVTSLRPPDPRRDSSSSRRGGRASRTRWCWPRATRCARRSTRPCCRRRGAPRASGASTRCSWRCTARRGAARSSSTCSSARRQDPARYIDLMELQYLCLAVGFCGKYHVLRARPQPAGRRAARPVSPDPRAPGRAADRSCRCGGRACRIAATRSFATCRGGWWARPRSRCSRSPSRSTTRRWPARPSPIHAAAGRRRPRGLRRPAGGAAPPGRRSSSCWRPDEAAGVADRRGAGRAHRDHAAGRDAVRVGERDGQRRAMSRCCSGWRPPSRRCPAGSWSSATPTTSPCGRCATATTSSCRANAPSSVVKILQARSGQRRRASTWTRRRLVAAALRAGLGSREPGAQPARGNRPRDGVLTMKLAITPRSDPGQAWASCSLALFIWSAGRTSRSPTSGRSSRSRRGWSRSC